MVAPQTEVYHSLTPSPTPTRPERRGVSRRSVIEEAKDKVKTIDLADRLAAGQGGGWRKVGAEWLRRCVLPDHEDKTPSFTVNPDKNLFWCHGCVRGGDVIELARHAWGYSKAEVPMAAAQLLHEFGHEIPKRPDSWFRKQERQQSIRDALEEANLLHHQRRVFRVFAPLVASVEDGDERREEERLLWEVAGEIAAGLVARRTL